MRRPRLSGSITGVVGITTKPFIFTRSSPGPEKSLVTMIFALVANPPILVHGSHASPKPSPSVSA